VNNPLLAFIHKTECNEWLLKHTSLRLGSTPLSSGCTGNFMHLLSCPSFLDGDARVALLFAPPLMLAGYTECLVYSIIQFLPIYKAVAETAAHN
jgi:hypothetical protein